MHAPNPHFLLYSEAGAKAGTAPRWRFVLQPIEGDQPLAASDAEPNTSGNRLELLAVVRGLEALEQPSRVTLITRSRYVSRGIRRSLSQWRDRQWRWERFGQLVPIRDLDLWQRVDRALKFHQVECCPSPLEEDANDASDTLDVAEVLTIQATPQIPAGAETTPAAIPLVESPATQSAERRTARRMAAPRPRRGRFSRTFSRLRQSVLAPFAAIWRPAFTRAA
jgi:ribonuclease HI